MGSAHLRVLPPRAAPETQRGKAASQGCTVRQEILLLRARLSAGTAELHRGPEGVNDSPGGDTIGKSGRTYGVGGEVWERQQEGNSIATVCW